jgi:uncharacterized protein (DUF302 family)
MATGLTVRTGSRSVAETVAALDAALQRRGIERFAAIDHAAGARAVGLELADEVVVVFGNPAVGTALIQHRPEVGIELPLRILVRDDGGTTVIAYRDPVQLVERYGLEGDEEILRRLGAVLDALAAEIA